MNRRSLAVMCGVVLALSGCSHANNRSPQDLLSLSVSGLSGVDRYAFSGETGIGTGSRAAVSPVAFKGTVENHDQVSVQGTGVSTLATQTSPLALLSAIEAAAVKTEVVPEESNGRTTVLRITTDPNKTTVLWASRLRGEFELLEKKVPANLAAKQQGQVQGHAQVQGKGTGNGNKTGQSALDAAWKSEITRSKGVLESMLATLKAESTCKLTIDRKKLLPLSLEERTVFHYQSDGKPAEENRTTRLTFNL